MLSNRVAFFIALATCFFFLIADFAIDVANLVAKSLARTTSLR
jgi:hypothetical protein